MPPAPSQLFTERFPDPLTGWAMVGVGAVWPTPVPDGVTAELRFDGSPRVQTAVLGTAFGTQAPLETGIERIQVVLRQGVQELMLADDLVASLRQRGGMAPTGPPVPRWLSPAVTLGRSVRSGELFTAGWWAARATRYADFARRGRLKLRDRKLLRGDFAPRTVHAAYAAATDPTAADLTAFRAAAGRFRTRPTFSILCPVYNSDPRLLDAAVDSVRAQVYPHWELCLADDASTDPATKAYLAALPPDPRVKLVRRPTNGHIVAATNSAADLATGEFVALLDHDDLLAPHALFRYAELLQTHPDADVIYSDEDKLDAAGTRYDPQFKPDWSPELLLSYNYANHLTCIRRTAFETAGRFRPGTDGAQDLDLLLRVTDKTDRVHHVPEVLYHWRATPDSTASAAGVKPYVHTAAATAVTEALRRRGVPTAVETPAFARQLGLPIIALAPAAGGPTVAVVVHGPAAAAGITSRAVKATTNYSAFTTYLVLDDTAPADALNRMAAARTEDVLVFLEAGIEPADPDWLGRLVAYLALPGVGAAGGLVLAPDGRIVSAGTVRTDPSRHAFAGVRPEPVSYYFLAESGRIVSAPGRGCLATHRSVFDRAGGFDADRFGRTLFDLDYCTRLAGLGYRTVHVGGATFTADPDALARRDAPAERKNFRAAHGRGPDPYTNPNLSRWADFRPDSLPDAVHPATPAGPIAVLFATHNLTGCEGAPQVLRDIALGLAGRGVAAARVYAPSPGPGAAAFAAAGIPVEAAGEPFAARFIDGQWTPAEYAAAQTALRAAIRRAAPRVVVANTLGLFPLVEAAARCGVPAVWVIHESYTADQFRTAFSPFGGGRAERAFLFAERVVFVSKSCSELYARLDGRKNFTVVHNALDDRAGEAFRAAVSPDEVRRRVGGRPGILRFLTVGTVCERKAQHTLVEAAAIVSRTRRDFVCSLVGARAGLPYLSYVRNLAAARGVAALVETVPETDTVPTHLRAADVFVCTSYVEAFSLSILEAMAAGLPVLSTRCGGLDEQVTWGQNARQFGFGDADGLAAHMLEMLEKPDRRQAFGAAARAAFELMPGPGGVLDEYARLIRHAARERV